jgi:hypothetical protein
LVLLLIFQGPVQNFELRDLNPRRSKLLVVLLLRVRNLRCGYGFQDAVGARFQVER